MRAILLSLVMLFALSARADTPITGWWKGTLHLAELTCDGPGWNKPWQVNVYFKENKHHCAYNPGAEWEQPACQVQIGNGNVWRGFHGLETNEVDLKWHTFEEHNGYTYQYYSNFYWTHKPNKRVQMASVQQRVYIGDSFLCSGTYKGQIRWSAKRVP